MKIVHYCNLLSQYIFKFLLSSLPFENLISEIISFLWWKETMSSTVSAFTTRKLPSFKPTAKAFPSGEKAQHLPPAEKPQKALVTHGFTVRQAGQSWRHLCLCLCTDTGLSLTLLVRRTKRPWLQASLPSKLKDNEHNVKPTFSIFLRVFIHFLVSACLGFSKDYYNLYICSQEKRWYLKTEVL